MGLCAATRLSRCDPTAHRMRLPYLPNSPLLRCWPGCFPAKPAPDHFLHTRARAKRRPLRRRAHRERPWTAARPPPVTPQSKLMTQRRASLHRTIGTRSVRSPAAEPAWRAMHGRPATHGAISKPVIHWMRCGGCCTHHGGMPRRAVTDSIAANNIKAGRSKNGGNDVKCPGVRPIAVAAPTMLRSPYGPSVNRRGRNRRGRTEHHPRVVAAPYFST